MENGRTFIFAASIAIMFPCLGAAEIIHLKAKQGKLADVISALEDGTPVDLPATSYVTIKGVTPLFVAAQFGHSDVVAALLERGADPNLFIGSTAGDSVPLGTPLHAATGNGHEEVVRQLIEAGADVTAHTYATGPPLHLARVRGHNGVEQILIVAGAPLFWEAPGLPAPLESADLVRGAHLARGCEQCHGVPDDGLPDGPTAPNLFGIVGRMAGAASDYAYSRNLEASGVHWSPETLNSYLASPFRFMPGTTKYPTEITNPEDRLDLIGYLASLSDGSESEVLE